MRMRFGHSIALKALDQKHWQIMLGGAGLLRELVYMIQAAAHVVKAIAHIYLPTLSDPRETCGPRIDSIPLARLTTSATANQEIIFFAPQ